MRLSSLQSLHLLADQYELGWWTGKAVTGEAGTTKQLVQILGRHVQQNEDNNSELKKQIKKTRSNCKAIKEKSDSMCICEIIYKP